MSYHLFAVARYSWTLSIFLIISMHYFIFSFHLTFWQYNRLSYDVCFRLCAATRDYFPRTCHVTVMIESLATAVAIDETEDAIFQGLLMVISMTYAFNALLTELSVGCHVQCVVDGTMMEPITETKSTKGTKESHHHSSYPSSVTAFTQGWDPGLACNMTVFLYPLSAIWRWSFHTNTSSACCSLAIEVNYSHLRLSAAERRLFSRCTAHGRRACFLVFFIHCRSMSFVTYLNVTQWADRK